MKKSIIKILFIYLLLQITLTYSYAQATVWQSLAPGVDYAKLAPKLNLFSGVVHAFRIDLNKYQLALVSTQSLNDSHNSVQTLVLNKQAVLGINGGFFSPDLEPLGLRINDGILLNAYKYISWWGVFYISNNKPNIVAGGFFKRNKNMSFAIQAGPRLIVNGKILSLKPGVDDRSALGITKDGKVVIVATDNLPLTTNELAEIMRLSTKNGGLDCIDAINLDGGTSTQLFAQINHFVLNLPGYKPVADAILVLPKN